MQHTKTEDKRTAKRIRIISTQFLLVIYDFLIAVIACFPVVYGSDDLHMPVLWLHLILIIAVIFCIRLLLKVYKQVWRYGSIQSYLRLVIADSLAFVVYFAIDRFLTPGYVIVFSQGFGLLLYVSSGQSCDAHGVSLCVPQLSFGHSKRAPCQCCFARCFCQHD